MSLDLDDPSAREAAFGPAGAAYIHKGVTEATDGTCKSNGAIGAALVSKDGCLQAQSPVNEDLTILTNSLSSVNLLISTLR